MCRCTGRSGLVAGEAGAVGTIGLLDSLDAAGSSAALRNLLESRAAMTFLLAVFQRKGQVASKDGFRLGFRSPTKTSKQLRPRRRCSDWRQPRLSLASLGYLF
jgi:hypothetical protein